MSNLFEKIGYDTETQEALKYARKRTGLTNMSLVILHENTKADNKEFLDKVNTFICSKPKGGLKEINKFIFDNNTMELPKTK